jgi:hypothetical protein
MTHKEAILLQIHRNFTENEIVQFLKQELSKAEFRIGELTSEVGELKHTIKEQNVIINNRIGAAKEEKLEFRKDAYVASLVTQIANLRKSKSKAENDLITWRNKYYQEKLKHDTPTNLSLVNAEE